MKAPPELAGALRSPLFWLEVGTALAVGVCFTAHQFGAGWVLAGVWLLILVGDLATRGPARTGGGDGDGSGEGP